MAAWPAVVKAIASRANAVIPTGVRVARGSDLSQSPTDVIYVGLQDVDDFDWTSAGTFQQAMQSFGGAREETGFVNCVALARDGGGDQDAATSNALAYLAAIEADLRANKTLGLTQFDYVVAQMDSGEIRERQGDDGASTALPFVISYKIRIQ